jgi:predicted hydrocarbon binding protein
MSDKLSNGDEVGVEPIKGEGWMHYRFHGGPQVRVNRVVLLGTGTFIGLQKGAEELIGKQSDAVFYDAGIKSGWEGWYALHTELKEHGDALIRKMFSFTGENGFGWFRIKDLNIESEAKRGSITVSHSFIAHTYGKAEKPVCHFIAGFIAGFISAAWGVEVACDEISCSAVRGDLCVFGWEAV